MAIVSEKNVSDALAYLAIDPHPIALARKDVTDAETNRETIYSRLLLNSEEGSDARRKADAMQHPSYLGAKAEESCAIFDLKRHEQRKNAAEMLIEVWRSENANVRAAERVR